MDARERARRRFEAWLSAQSVLTQTEVARLLKTTQPTVSRYASGGFSLSELDQIAAVMGITADALVAPLGDSTTVTRPVHPYPKTDGPQEEPAMPEDARARLARFVSEMLPDVAALIEREVHELYGRRLLSDGSPAKKKEGH